MILIVGTIHDDVLYFDAQLKNKEEKELIKNVKVVFGELYNQNICLVYNIYSNYMSSSIVSLLIEKYDIIAVFNVGSCHSYSDDLNSGDILVSDVVLLGDVSLGSIEKVKRGEIPSFPSGYIADTLFTNYIIKFSKNFMISNIHNGIIVSTNKEFTSKEEIKGINDDEVVLGKSDHIAFESNSGGCAFASYLFDVPFVAVKVVIDTIKGNISTKEKILTLRQYANVGKLISSTIGEIGRNDTISLANE